MAAILHACALLYHQKIHQQHPTRCDDYDWNVRRGLRYSSNTCFQHGRLDEIERKLDRMMEELRAQTHYQRAQDCQLMQQSGDAPHPVE
jgi:hypothetical protein